MSATFLTRLLLAAGAVQLCIPGAAALVPRVLAWREVFRPLPRLVRQLCWVYGGYTLMSIVALGLITLVNARQLAEGSLLARSFCLYGLIFWGVRLGLGCVLDARPHLTTRWLRLGYDALLVAFVLLVLVFAAAVFVPPG